MEVDVVTKFCAVLSHSWL